MRALFPSWLRLPAKLLALAALLAPASQANAQPLELSVKAAFLPKFARYVAWPPYARPGPGEAVRLCVIGDDPFGRVLDRAVSGERIDDHPIVIRRLSGLDGAAQCHIAFVNGGSGRSTAQLLAGLRQLPVLTVTDARQGGDRGMIHFTIHQGRVAFHIDDAAAARSNLAISSRLLGLAVSVRQRG